MSNGLIILYVSRVTVSSLCLVSCYVLCNSDANRLSPKLPNLTQLVCDTLICPFSRALMPHSLFFTVLNLKKKKKAAFSLIANQRSKVATICSLSCHKGNLSLFFSACNHYLQCYSMHKMNAYSVCIRLFGVRQDFKTLYFQTLTCLKICSTD